jgi:hypothetical protein
MTVARLGSAIACSDTDQRRWRLIWEFLEEFRHEPIEKLQRLLDDEPPLTGDEKFDLYLAALTEHLAYHNALKNPSWTMQTHRLWIGKVWFPTDLPGAKVWALAHSPAAFRARGIFIHPDDLIRA